MQGLVATQLKGMKRMASWRAAHESKTYRSDVPWDTRDGPMTSDEDVRRLRYACSTPSSPAPPQNRCMFASCRRSQYIHGGQGDEHQSSSAAERQMSDAQQAREHIKQVLRKRGLRYVTGEAPLHTSTLRPYLAVLSLSAEESSCWREP